MTYYFILYEEVLQKTRNGNISTTVEQNEKQNNRPIKQSEASDVDEIEDPSFIGEIKIYFRNFCNHTGIHGFQYFGQHRTLIEKIWWLLVFLITFSACAFCIFLIYEKWATSPVIVSLATKETPIYQIPFPAVTICPTIKYTRECFRDDELFSVRNKRKLAEYTLSLCKKQTRNSRDNGTFKDAFYTEHFFKTLLKCSPFARSNFTVRFMNRYQFEFSKVFLPVITDDGICFSFNMMDRKEIFSDNAAKYHGFVETAEPSQWIPQVGYPEEAELDTYPRRALLSGAINSLEIIMGHSEKDINYECNGAEQGYKVLLHIPCRIARPTMESIMVPFNKATTITVIPEMMSTSSRVKKYDPETRNCYFPGEKQLRFFKIYTKNSCDMECLANYTLRFCNCVGFWMPRKISFPICGPAKLNCLSVTKDAYELMQLNDKLKEERLKRQLAAAKKNKTIESFIFWKPNNEEEVDENIKNLEEKISSVKNECNCFPICSDLTYVGTASSLDFRWEEQSENKTANNTPIDEKAGGLTQINIFIKTNDILTRERNELYGPTDFISNFGGLLGLFSGFSILSFMEIVYYLTLRIIGNCKKFGRWYGEEEK
ncbi:hypothetical protein HHI36_015355 [Cryptolaemus montrouzieri]|uniref:Pickpocket protein 28-like n=1 Tax=Cryptolaemus montrouzieri TaxID=559131 RepID=A0ABD2N598_9CUCU